MWAALAAVMAAALAVAMAAALAVAAMAAGIGNSCGFSFKRLVCFGRRAFFIGLRISARRLQLSMEDYCGRTSMPVTVA
jgi:hypothetical protein